MIFTSCLVNKQILALALIVVSGLTFSAYGMQNNGNKQLYPKNIVLPNNTETGNNTPNFELTDSRNLTPKIDDKKFEDPKETMIEAIVTPVAENAKILFNGTVTTVGNWWEAMFGNDEKKN